MIEFQCQSWISNAESIISTVATKRNKNKLLRTFPTNQESQVPADKITQNNNSHAQFYFHKNSSFFCQIIESQVSGDKLTQFNNIQLVSTCVWYRSGTSIPEDRFQFNEDAWKTEQ